MSRAVTFRWIAFGFVALAFCDLRFVRGKPEALDYVLIAVFIAAAVWALMQKRVAKNG